MTLSTGTQLGPYEIVAPLGAGGMGEVYRARDTKLDRDVAIKVLPDTFARDPERVARFQREAKVLASLNHPNIAAIHGFEESEGKRFLILELVEGETLAERLRGSALPVDEALEVCKQIAEALEAAHERGVIHRDLKPANVKVTPEGVVKVLDFGLAKAFGGDSSSTALADSPTITVQHTRPGVVLGTAAYMSPEQARGKPLDKRTDIWSFGCLLYECLTGHRPFDGETASDTIAKILERDPDFDALPGNTPLVLGRLLRRCLAKDVRERLRDIGDARLDIEQARSGDGEAVATAATSPRPARLGSWMLVMGGVVLGVFMMFGFFLRTEDSRPSPRSRFSVRLPPEGPLVTSGWPVLSLAIAPDGSRFAYSGGSNWAERRLYLRSLDSLEIDAIADTEGGLQPFFSPDGRWIGFFTLSGELKKAAVEGGKPVTLLDGLGAASFWSFGSWGEDDRIVFCTGSSGLQAINADGGAPRLLVPPPERGSSYTSVQILPGSDTAIYTVEEDSPRSHLMLVELSTGKQQVLLKNAAHGRYLASGHLLFVRGETLLAAPFDLKRKRVTGSSVPLRHNTKADHPRSGTPLHQLAAAANGILVYAPSAVQAGGETALVWLNRDGVVEETVRLPIRVPYLRLSPDGRRLALGARDERKTYFQVYDLARGVLTRLTVGDFESLPVWSPKGDGIVFFSRTPGPGLYWKEIDSDGAPELLLAGDRQIPFSWSRDGRYLAYASGMAELQDIWILSMDGERKPQPFLTSEHVETMPSFSPDGRWLAYVSNETGGRWEVYVRRFPDAAMKTLISTDGGSAPLWAPDGSELFYQSVDGKKMMAVAITTEPDLRVGEPWVLFEGYYAEGIEWGVTYDVSRDGRRFLMVQFDEDPHLATELVVVMNWFEELERLVPTDN